MNRWIVPAAMVGLVALLGVGLLTPRNDDPPSALLGKEAPTFALQSLDGQTYDLAKLRGKPVVINFWASWCDPCHAEAPIYAQKSGELAGKVQFLGILYNDQPQPARAFMERYGLKFPTLKDPNSGIAMKYGIGQVPVTYVLDRAGNVIYHQLGEVTEPEFSEALKKAAQ